MTSIKTIFCLFAMCCIALTMAQDSSTRPPRRRTGAFSDVQDINAPNVQNAINAGAEHIASKPGNPCRTGLVVQKVQKQVVSGIKYRVTFRAEPTACGSNSAVARVCTVDVVHQSWLNKTTPFRPRCQDA